MKCPICDQPVKWQDNPFRPFCSERCKLIDFGRWANEEYRVPGPESPRTDIETTTSASNDGLSANDE